MIKFMDLLKEDISDQYPLYISERNKKWIDLLRNAVEKKFIWNVDFKEANFALSRNFDDIGRWVSNGKGGSTDDNFTVATAKYAGVGADQVRHTQYSVSQGTFQNFQSINKLIRIFEKAVVVDDGTSKVIQKYLELYKSWKTIKDMLDAVKSFITKGRRIDPTKPSKPIYQPPTQSTKVLGEIKVLLENLIEKHKEELKQGYVDMVTGMADRFMKERTPAAASPGKFFKFNSYIVSLIDSLFEFDEKRDPWEYEWYKGGRIVKIRYRSDANEKIEKFAVRQANAAAEDFVASNMRKLTSVIGEKVKGGTELVNKTVDGSFGVSFSGRMSFKFSDSTGFITRNDITMNVSPRGLVFNQFPITFHDVTFKDGTFRKFVPEKTMNEIWAKEQ
jgi:hypothetical protein